MSALERPVHIPWTMRLGSIFAAASVAVSVGCASPTEIEEQPGSTSAAIVGGQPSSAASDFAVRLDIGTGEFCTGVLLTPNLVLTARHCVSTMNANSECGTFIHALSPRSIAVSVGAGGPQPVARGKTLYLDDGNVGCSHDVALVQLDVDVTAPVASIRFGKVTKGEAATTIGYGDDGHGAVTPGRYEKSGLVIDAVGPSTESYATKSGRHLPFTVPTGELVTGESTCFGDSGGPLLDATGAVIGVTSRGIDRVCLDRPTLYSDVASHADLIRTAAQRSGHALVETTDATTATPAAAVGTKLTPGVAPPTATTTADDAGAPVPNESAAPDAPASGGCSTVPSRGGFGSALWVLAVAGIRRLRASRSCARSSSR